MDELTMSQFASKDDLLTAQAARIAELEAALEAAREQNEALRGTVYDEIAANLAFREAAGAKPDEDMPTFTARIVRELEAAREDAEACDRLIAKWERQADEHGVRQFTGNDHKLFANELRAAIDQARGKGGGEVG